MAGHKNIPHTKSMLRRIEYATLAQLSIDGPILDIGGSTKSGYHDLIGGEHTILTGNIDASYGCDIIFDAEEAWPVENDTYSAVLLINILEHLYNYEHAVAETHRVLKNDGRVIGVVPFMLNIHAAPRDFFRYSRYTLERLLTDQGFSDIKITELGTGLFSLLYQSSITLVPLFLSTPLIAIARGLDGLCDRLKPGSALSRKYMPLGYYFEARK